MLFRQNRHTSLYNSLIDRARNRTTSEYTEKHHVVPKALGGGNEKQNLVRLTAREHLLAHKLLVRMTEGRDRSKMISALWAMCTLRSKGTSQRVMVNSHTYEAARRAFAEKESKRLTGVPKSEDHKRKIGLAHKGRLKSEEMKKLLSATRTGMKVGPMSDERKLALSRKKIELSADHHLAVSCTFRGVQYSTINAASRATGLSQYLIKKHESFRRS